MSRTTSLAAALAFACADLASAGPPTACYSADVAQTVNGLHVPASDGHCRQTDGTLQAAGLPQALASLRGANVDALSQQDGHLVFSLDAQVVLDGSFAAMPGDILRCDDSACTSFTVLLDGLDFLPRNLNVDAVAFSLDNGDLLYSLDVDATLDGTAFRASDVIRWDGTTHSLASDGSKLPPSVGVDAIDMLAGNRMVFSTDVAASIASGLASLPTRNIDLIENVLGNTTFGFAAASLQPDPDDDYSDWAPGANLDAVHLGGLDRIFADGFEL